MTTGGGGGGGGHGMEKTPRQGDEAQPSGPEQGPRPLSGVWTSLCWPSSGDNDIRPVYFSPFNLKHFHDKLRSNPAGFLHSYPVTVPRTEGS